MTRYARLAVLPLLASLAAGVHLTRVTADRAYVRGQAYSDTYYLPPPNWLPVMSLGFDAALADLIWMRALLYFGEELLHRGQVRYLYQHADAILALDPDFRAVYHWIAVASLYRAGGVTAEDGYRAVRYLERGLERWPDDGELHWDLGATLRFELPPLIEDPEEKERVKARAAGPLAEAARRGAGPAWLALSSSALLAKLGRTEQAIRHLTEMYSMVHDPSVKKQILTRLESLRSQTYAEAFREAEDQLETRRKNDAPYLSSDLYFLLDSALTETRSQVLEQRFLPAEVTFTE